MRRSELKDLFNNFKRYNWIMEDEKDGGFFKGFQKPLNAEIALEVIGSVESRKRHGSFLGLGPRGLLIRRLMIAEEKGTDEALIESSLRLREARERVCKP